MENKTPEEMIKDYITENWNKDLTHIPLEQHHVVYLMKQFAEQEREKGIPKKNLQECKEKVARKSFYRSWSELLYGNSMDIDYLSQKFDEVAELYLQSNQSGWSDEDMRKCFEAGYNEAAHYPQRGINIPELTFDDYLNQLKSK